MKWTKIMFVALLAMFFSSGFSVAEEMRAKAFPDNVFQLMLPDRGNFAFNPACIEWQYLAVDDRNTTNTGPEDNNEIKPVWQTPKRLLDGKNPMLEGIYRFKVKRPGCSEIHIFSEVGNNYVLQERQLDHFFNTTVINMMMKKGYTAEKLVPVPKGQEYYYVRTFFYHQGDLATIPKDATTVGHLVPDDNGFIHKFIKQGDPYPFGPFFPYVKVTRKVR